MVTIVAKYYEYVVGVDTHAKKHVFALVNNLGERIGGGECRVLERDFRHTLLLIRRKTGYSKTLFAIEGTSSYGETLTRFLMNEGADVCEVRPPKVKSRGNTGKTDQIDAEMAARNILHLPVNKLIRPRVGDERKILRITLGSRNNLVKQQIMDKNALNALVRSIDIGIDARKTLTYANITELASSRRHRCDAPHEVAARSEIRRLATCIVGRRRLLDANEATLESLVRSIAPTLLNMSGVGPVSAAQILCAYSHKGRIRSPEAFCALAGVAPIPASSGNTIRHRLSRFGDRTLNHALDVVARTRMRFDEETKTYVEKRTKLGSSPKETKRALKRYIARILFKQLELLNFGVD